MHARNMDAPFGLGERGERREREGGREREESDSKKNYCPTSKDGDGRGGREEKGDCNCCDVGFWNLDAAVIIV